MRYGFCILILTIFCCSVLGQTNNDKSSASLSPETASKYLDLLTSKFSKLHNNIEKQTNRALQRVQKQEAKLYKQLAKKDTAAANRLFKQQQVKYAAMLEKLHNAGNEKQPLKEYLPHFDTLKSSLAFMEKTSGLNPAQLQLAKNELQQFEGKMQIANQISKQLKDRKSQLLNEFKKHGIGNKIKSIHKETYYYNQRLNEFKETLSNHAKLEKKILSYLAENFDFKNFFFKNSSLAKIFRLPSTSSNTASIIGNQGLQNRVMIQTSLRNILSTSNQINPEGFLQTSLNQVNTKIESIKTKLSSLKNNSNPNTDVDRFKPNHQKTKTFFDRLEYGFNLQTQKQNNFFPVTSDLAGTLAYRLSDTKILGFGASYKMGWGSGFKDLKLTNQGFAMRSFLDIRIKKNWWLYGGYEKHLEQSQTEGLASFWQESGLVGINKKTKISRKIVNTQLLFDFLYNYQVPKRQPIIFRVGWTFSKK